MARARNIKPALFKNELLGIEEPLLTLLFIGLWTLADREGRLEDRPLRIKAELFPYREGLEMEAMLSHLEELGFIGRYTVDGNSYIQVLNFSKHQNPHRNEKASEIPPPGENREKVGTSTVQAPEKDSTTRADSFNLIPDSLNPITDTSTPPVVSENETTQEPVNRKKRISEDFVLTEHRANLAIRYWNQHGRTDLEPTLIFEQFVSHHKAKGSLMADWDAAWTTWYMHSPKFEKQAIQSTRERTMIDDLTDRSWAN